MSNEGIVPIQVTVPGADPAADALLRVGAAAGKLGDSAGAAKPKVEGVDASLRKIAESSKSSEQLLKNLSATGNAAFQALTEKAGQFAKTVGDSAMKGLGDFAEVGVKSLAAFGPWGIAATAAIGVVGLAVNTYREYEAQLERTRAISESTAAATAALGGSYSTVTAAAAAATTAEAARLAVARETQTILQAQLSLVGQGFSAGQSEALTASFQRLSDATRVAGTSVNALSPAMIQHAVLSGNAAEQQRVLGMTLLRSSDAATQQAQAVQLSAQMEATATRLRLVNARDAARAATEAYEAERRRSTADETSLGTLQRLRPASVALGAARRELTAATSEAEARERALASAAQATAAATEEANTAGKALARQRLDDNAAERRHARQASAAAGAPSAQEQRAAIEALRVAREANDNAGAQIDFTARQVEAQRALTFATNELAVAERRLATGRPTAAERTATTTALRTYLQAQEALTAAETEEAAAMQAKNAALRAEADARAEVNARTREQLLAGPALERQAAAQARALNDAQLAASAALAASQANVANDNGNPRVALLRAEEAATIALRAAQTELWHANDEVNRSLVASVEQRQRLIAATNGVAAATDRQSAAQRAVNADVAKIRTDRTDALEASARGLAGGLMESAVAAAIAGENIGAAMQKQLAASLAVLSAESAQRSLFSLASAFFQVGMGRLDLAGPLFVSAATFAAVAVGSGVAAAALTPSTPAASSGGGSGGSTAGNVSPPSQQGGGGGNVYYTVFNAPVIGGRESTDAELGERLRRFDRAAGGRR